MHLIDSCWSYSNDETECFKILPDTYTDIIIDLNLNQAFVSGVMTSFQNRLMVGPSNLLGMRFRSEYFACICKVPSEELTNQRVNLSDLLPTSELTPLFDAKTDSEKTEYLNNLINCRYQEYYDHRDKMILAIAGHIRALKGKVKVGNLAQANHISTRQLERRFRKQTGLTVKQFAGIVRFTNAKNVISGDSKTSLLNIAFETGFYDHAHMNYEFNRIAGESPGVFR